jgi:hypothetical protein
MRRVRGVVVLSFAVAIVATGPAGAAANNPTRPIKGSRSDTLTLNPTTGVGTTVGSGHLSHLGTWTSSDQVQFVPTGATTFIFFTTAPSALVTASGAELFVTASGSGQTNGDGTSTSETTYTITGGTDRFADATGTLTETLHSTLIGLDASGNQIFHDEANSSGTISY